MDVLIEHVFEINKRKKYAFRCKNTHFLWQKTTNTQFLAIIHHKKSRFTKWDRLSFTFHSNSVRISQEDLQSIRKLYKWSLIYLQKWKVLFHYIHFDSSRSSWSVHLEIYSLAIEESFLKMKPVQRSGMQKFIEEKCSWNYSCSGEIVRVIADQMHGNTVCLWFVYEY